MKKKFFVVLLALVAVFCLSLGISACAGGGGPEAETPSTPSTPSTPDDEGGEEDKEKDDEEKQKEEAAKSLAEAVERLDTFLGRIGENYCYTAAGTQYELASDVLKVTEGDTVYYMRDEKENYIIAQNGEIWERDFCNDNSVWETAENCLSVFENVEWTAYAEGELRAEDILLRFSGEGDETAVSWVKDGAEYALSDVGDVEIVLPAYKDLAQYVYETVDGVRKYNIPTLVHALDETLKADGAILAKANGTFRTELIKITHIKNNDEGLGFGCICCSPDNADIKCYKYFIIKETHTAEKLTVSAFQESLGLKSLKMEDNIPYIETTTLDNDPEFQTMAQNALKKLAQDGCQGYSIFNKADPLPEYENAEILFSYRANSRDAHYFEPGAISHGMDFMLIVKLSNRIEQIFFSVFYLISDNYLINFDKSKVVIITFEREEIDSDNAKLYAESDPAPVSAAFPVTLFYEEKRR